MARWFVCFGGGEGGLQVVRVGSMFLGCQVVVVPGRKIWKVKRYREYETNKVTQVDSGNQNLTENQVQEKFTEMASGLNNLVPVAEGKAGHDSMSSLLANFAKMRAAAGSPAASGSSGPLENQSPARTEAAGTGLMSLSSLLGSAVSVSATSTQQSPQKHETQPKDTENTGAAKGKKRTKTRGKAATAPLQQTSEVKSEVDEKDVKPSTPSKSKSGSKPGRPKRDLGLAAKEYEEEFSAVTLGGATFAAWFGAAFKNTRRSIKRLADELQEEIQGTDDENVFKEMTKHKKVLESIIAACDFVAKNGIDHADLDTLMSNQDHYLKLDPAASVRWPAHLKSKTLEQRLRKEEKPEEFWKCLEGGDTILGVDPDACEAKRVSIIAERIVAITKEEDAQNTLRLWFPESIKLTSFSRAIQDQVSDVVEQLFYEEEDSVTMSVSICLKFIRVVPQALASQRIGSE